MMTCIVLMTTLVVKRRSGAPGLWRCGKSGPALAGSAGVSPAARRPSRDLE